MTIKELMYYGRYYSFEKEDHHLWWFDSKTAVVFQYDELVTKFGYGSQEEVINSQRFIPLFKTDIVELEFEFLSIQNCKFVRQLKKQKDLDFDVTFKKFIEKNNLTESWRAFENNRLFSDAIEWCKENNIRNVIVI